MTKLDKKIESIIYGNLDDFEIYDFEATNKHISQIKKVIREEIEKKMPKLKSVSYSPDVDREYKSFNKAVLDCKSVIKDILD